VSRKYRHSHPKMPFPLSGSTMRASTDYTIRGGEFLSRKGTNERSILSLPQARGLMLGQSASRSRGEYFRRGPRAFAGEKQKSRQSPEAVQRTPPSRARIYERLHYGLVISITPHTPTDSTIETDRRVYAPSLSLYCEIHRVGVLGKLFSDVCNLLAEQ